MSKIDKKELHSIFIKIRNNDKAEFNVLYEKYKTLVYGVAFSIIKNKEDSEEIVQSVFMKIFKLEKEKLPKENEASWLYTFSKNVTLNFLRGKKEEIDIDELYYITDTSKELEDIIEKDTYNRIISKLNKKEQEIVSLKILSNLSFKEISNVLDIPIGTVQWKYYKAIHTLKLLLSSLSMYILTVIIFILQKDTRKTKKIETQIKPKDEQQEEIKQEGSETEDTKKEDEEQKKQETVRDDVENSKTETNNTITNSISTETQKNNTIANSTSTETQRNNTITSSIDTEMQNNNTITNSISTETQRNNTITSSIDTQMQNNNTITNNISTETQNNSIQVEQENNNKLDLIDVGILSLCIVFLISTIILSVFFIKNQQKAKKKVSK